MKYRRRAGNKCAHAGVTGPANINHPSEKMLFLQHYSETLHKSVKDGGTS